METAVSRSYAQALFEVALEQGALERVEQDLRYIAARVGAIDGLEKILASPVIPAAQKKSLLEPLFGGQIQESTLNFLKLLADKRRMGSLVEITRAYQERLRDHQGIQNATVTSSQPLSEETKRQLAKTLSDKTGKQIHIENQIDPAVLAGIRIRIGNEQMDATLKSRLENLKAALVGPNVR